MRTRDKKLATIIIDNSNLKSALEPLPPFESSNDHDMTYQTIPLIPYMHPSGED